MIVHFRPETKMKTEKNYSFSAENENGTGSKQIMQQHIIMKFSILSSATVLTFNAKYQNVWH